MSYKVKKQKNVGNHSDTLFLRDEKNREKRSLPNSMVLRLMEDNAAEQEADRLSGGLTSGTPDSVMTEMGDRLGAGPLSGADQAGHGAYPVPGVGL